MGIRNQLLIDHTIEGFLKEVYNGRPEDVEPLSRAIGVLADVMQISQIRVTCNEPLNRAVTVYKRYDTRMLNAPDWERIETSHMPEDTKLEFW